MDKMSSLDQKKTKNLFKIQRASQEAENVHEKHTSGTMT